MGTYRLSKAIPKARSASYSNIGWSVGSSNDELAFVTKEIQTGTQDDYTDIQDRAPYLVQRGLIRRPLGQYVECTLTQAVEMEYMGAAQFEYGALPKSLRRIEAQFMLYKKVVAKNIVANIRGREFDLRVLANFDSPEREAEYLTQLREVIEGQRYIEERLGMDTRGGKLSVTDRTDFWWDITNDVFFSFDKQFMSRIQNHLQASFSAMNDALPK
jgi:hypothetical protein